MIDLSKAKEAAMFAQTFVADPEHDYFLGPEVPQGEAWELTTLWMRVGKGGLNEAMVGIVQDDTFVSLSSRRRPIEGDGLSWSGGVLMTEGMRILYLAEGAVQEEEIACSATWKVLVGPEAALAELRKEWQELVQKIKSARAELAETVPGDNGSTPPAKPKGKPRGKGKPKGKAKDEAGAAADK